VGTCIMPCIFAFSTMNLQIPKVDTRL
jgi:hypothetical protein